MSEEPLYEIKNILSQELCAEAVRKIYYVTKTKYRALRLIVAIMLSIVFVLCVQISLIQHNTINVLLSFIIFSNSVLLFYIYFRGYLYPKSVYQQHIKNLCTPQESVYIFGQTQFEYKAEQSSQIVLYAHIKQVIDSSKFVVLLGTNTEFVINKECLPKNYGELVNLLRNSSHCIYSK